MPEVSFYQPFWFTSQPTSKSLCFCCPLYVKNEGTAVIIFCCVHGHASVLHLVLVLLQVLGDNSTAQHRVLGPPGLEDDATPSHPVPDSVALSKKTLQCLLCCWSNVTSQCLSLFTGFCSDLGWTDLGWTKTLGPQSLLFCGPVLFCFSLRPTQLWLIQFLLCLWPPHCSP